MFEHEHKVRVRYGETDQMGYVYYGRYAEYLEVSRTEALRSIGLSYRHMEEKMGVMLPVVTLNIQYLKPAFYDDELTLRTRLKEMPKASISFYTDIMNARGDKLAEGFVKLCFVDMKTQKTTKAPEQIMNLLKPFFDE